MPGSHTAVDDVTERRRGSKTQVDRLPTPSDTGARQEDDFTLSQSLRVPARRPLGRGLGERTRFATAAAPLIGVLNSIGKHDLPANRRDRIYELHGLLSPVIQGFGRLCRSTLPRPVTPEVTRTCDDAAAVERWTHLIA
jgi:hypothetical protein